MGGSLLPIESSLVGVQSSRGVDDRHEDYYQTVQFEVVLHISLVDRYWSLGIQNSPQTCQSPPDLLVRSMG